MRYFLDADGVLRALEADGSQDFLITDKWIELTLQEADKMRLIPKTPEQLKDEAKKAGKTYSLNGKEYIVPLDKDAQDTVTAISVAHIAGLFVSTTMEFSNGVKMPIVAADWMTFAQWFVTERNSFFEVAP